MVAFKIGLQPPQDLARYTFPLFLLHIQGWHKAQEPAWRRAAFLGAIIINVNCKKKVTPDELLGIKSESPMPALSKEAFDAQMRRRIAAAEPADDALLLSDALLAQVMGAIE